MEQMLMQVLQAQRTSQEQQAAQFAAALQSQTEQQTSQSQTLATVITQQQAQAQLMQSQLDQLSQGMMTMMQQAAAGGTAATGSPPQTGRGSGPDLEAGHPQRHRLDEGDTVGIKSILHPGIVEKLPSHNGEEATFPAWRFKFEGLATLVGLDQYLQTSLDTEEADLKLSVQTDDDMAARAKAVLYLLVQLHSRHLVDLF